MLRWLSSADVLQEGTCGIGGQVGLRIAEVGDALLSLDCGSAGRAFSGSL